MNQFLRAKTKKKGGCRGFTLIELLVVVIIIGLLAGVLLITVRSAINKARDSRITAALGQIRTQAEIYFDNQVPPTFVGLGADADVVRAGADVTGNQGAVAVANQGLKWGDISANNYTVWAYLNVGGWYCIDADGYACKVTVLPAAGAARCGCPNEPS